LIVTGVQTCALPISDLLKGTTFGLATVVTAVPQGAVASFGSYVVGRAAKRYFENGASWGSGGPKRVVEQILETVDKGSVLARLQIGRASCRERVQT